MKSISASIVVFSGAILLASGSFVPHNQTQGTLQMTGALVGLIGLITWFWAMKAPRE